MKRMLTGICCLLALSVFAGDDPDYSILNIPAELMKNANVIKRMESYRYEITEKNKATIKQKVAYTILNDGGDPWATFWEWYDRFRSIESLDGTLYNAMGKKIKSLKKSEIQDLSGSDDASLADDNRVKKGSFYYKEYPFTVEFEVEIRLKGTMFLPHWLPQERNYMSVQSCKLTVVSPSSNPLHYKMFNYRGEPTITEEKDNKVYTWEVKDMPAVEYEYAAPSWRELTTSVFLATEKFTIGDYEGSNASWKDFGRFVYDLKKDRDVLPEDVKKKVHELTDGVTDPKEKVRKLYAYMQQNTRYISIQLGVGGWQPFDANFVASKKYGDCKALSNYMYSLLKEAGIKSVYTCITSSSNDNYLLTDLPSSQFNHIILFVPDGKDTTWLECTSQTLSAGYIGGGTGNRFALAVDENGGTLVRTPKYGKEENLQLRHITATIDETGMLKAAIQTKYMAEQQDKLHYVTTGLSRDKLMEYLKENIDLATYDVTNFSYQKEQSSLPVISEKLDLVADNYATVSGKRCFIVPNIISRTYRKIKPTESRKYDLVLDFEFRDVDSTEITIPVGYATEAVPQDVKIESKFGKYSNSIKVAGNKITYYRTYEHLSGRFPPADYNELVKFYEAVYKADRNRVVLVKNEMPAATEKKAF